MDSVNIDEIKKISKEEFQKSLIDWIDQRDISKSLQAKFRKELIEFFNHTSLGRKISYHYQKQNRLVLSPLILGINTLVAEFLYNQNCHYTLSVFSTEVPYRNTLPDFEQADRFRFGESEIEEIFEAVGLPLNNEKAILIKNLYLLKSPTSPSLLYCIIHYTLNGLDNNQPERKMRPCTTTVSKRKDKVGDDVEIDDKQCMLCSKIPRLSNDGNIKNLNKYLEQLSCKVETINKCTRHDDLSSDEEVNEVEQKVDKLDKLNKSITKVSAQLKMMNIKNNNEEKISSIINNVDKISNRLNKIVDQKEESNIVKINTEDSGTQLDLEEFNLIKVKSLVNENNVSKPKVELNYKEWIRELKNSENGQKFLNRLETSLQKTIAKERQKLHAAYEEKINSHRFLIRMHYKQKYLKEYQKMLERCHQQPCEDLKPLLLENAVCPKPAPRTMFDPQNIPPNMPTLSPIKLKDKENLICMEPKALSKHQAYNITITSAGPGKKDKLKKFKLNERPKSRNHKREKHLDRIVQSARDRITALEKESEKLDVAFENYLFKQDQDKSLLYEDVKQIWHNYNFGKTVIHKKIHEGRRSLLYEHRTKLGDNASITEDTKNIDTNRNTGRTESPEKVMKTPIDSNTTTSKSFNFENPFQQIDPSALLFKNLTQSGDLPDPQQLKSSDLFNDIEEIINQASDVGNGDDDDDDELLGSNGDALTIPSTVPEDKENNHTK